VRTELLESPTGAVNRIAFTAAGPAAWCIWDIRPNGTELVRVTSAAVVADSHPTWSPDRLKIAFERYSLYVINANGTNERRLTWAADMAPAWSPDGTRIAFTRLVNAQPHIFVMNATGGGIRRLTRTAMEDYAAWSPDSQKIAYQSTEGNGDWNIYTMNADGSNRRRRTAHLAQDEHPSWSADGLEIIFDSNRAGNINDIYKLTLSTGRLTRLTQSDNLETQADWSPDGSRIAFISGGPYSQGLYTMNPDGTGVRLVRGGELAWPDW
jgi:TolB protein